MQPVSALEVTGDTILLTQQCVEALTSRPPGLTDRGCHALKRKSAAAQAFASTQALLPVAELALRSRGIGILARG